MACGCSKNKVSAAANAARTHTTLFRPVAIAESLAPTHAKTGNRYQPTTYLVAPREELLALSTGDLALDEIHAEKLTTLAEAQKRIRDLGPGYGVKALRL